jgi:hypothetical protein
LHIAFPLSQPHTPSNKRSGSKFNIINKKSITHLYSQPLHLFDPELFNTPLKKVIPEIRQLAVTSHKRDPGSIPGQAKWHWGKLF